MNKSFNMWWLLPLITLVLGSIAALTVHRSIPATPVIIVPIEKPSVTENNLLITQVALPPAPIVYQPTLTATIENNRVVVNKDKRDRTDKLSSTVVDNRNKDSALKNVTAEQSALAAKFNQVLNDMANEKTKPQPTAKLHAQALTLYPQWYQNLVPDLEFSSHIFSSDVNERWVRVNNQVVKEGELINSDMRLVAIEPQQVIIEMQQRRFILPALSSW